MARRRKGARRPPRLAAGWADALADYMAGSPHRLLQSAGTRAVLLDLFSRTHPCLPSPETHDPAPVVRQFVQRVLAQFDDQPHCQDPGSDPEQPRRSRRLQACGPGGAHQ